MANQTFFPLFELRKLFYLIHPSEVCHIGDLSDLARLLNPGLFVILPFTLEVLVSREVLQNPSRTYDINDCLASFCTLLATTLERSYFRLNEFAFYAWLHERVRLVEVDLCSLPVFIATVLIIDFCRYWAHRLQHEVALLWSLHQLHHSSDYYNLFVGMRAWYTLEVISTLTMLPAAFFLPPAQFALHVYTIYIVGEWTHLPNVGRLGVLENVFVTPSAHRVHHGRSAYAIDKNYGTIFIFWDKLFGTYQAENDEAVTGEGEPLVFGTISPVLTYNPVRLLIESARKMEVKASEVGSIKTLVYGPGWAPGKPRLGDLEDIPKIDKTTPPVRLSIGGRRDRVDQTLIFVSWTVGFLACDTISHVQSWPSELHCILAHLLGFFVVFAIGEKLDAEATFFTDLGLNTAYLMLVWLAKFNISMVLVSACICVVSASRDVRQSGGLSRTLRLCVSRFGHKFLDYVATNL